MYKYKYYNLCVIYLHYNYHSNVIPKQMVPDKYILLTDYDQQQMIVKGIVALLHTESIDQRRKVLNEVAALINLEDMIGDRDFSFILAISIPKSCRVIMQHERVLLPCTYIVQKYKLQALRTRFYVKGSRL